MRLSLTQVAQLLGYAVVMACGQLLFKRAAAALGQGATPAESVLRLAGIPAFWAACVLYAFATVLWVWLLTRIPLSVAYPIAALSLAIVPVLSWALYREPLTARYWGGLALMFGGMVLLTRA